MSATTAAPQINIPMFLQAALCQCFERMSRALRRGDVSLRDDPLTDNVRLFLEVCLVTAIAVVILGKLQSNDLEDFQALMRAVSW